nr:hypothetical protein BaRGS_023034 [Batillaria attramentaria]
MIIVGAPVYVNYGRIEDFQFLANNHSINFTGRVVIARYGKIFRGDKVHNAERFNASAVILYSDPYDFNKQEGSEKPQVRVVVNNYMKVKPVHNVIGYIKGSEEPGHRPRRTLVFCSWDAEESGLMGSVEWVEDNLKLLQQRGVAYLNVDYAVDGHYSIAVGSSPLLQDVLYAVAKKLKLDILSYPLYHSSYETFFFYDTYIDPGFNFTKAMAQMWALTASELANAELLPFKVERYSQAVSSFLDSLMESFEQQWDLHKVNVDAFKSAVSNFTKATKTFQQNLNTDKNLNNSLHVRIINDCLMQLERAFLDPEGLPGRKDQKHVMFAPSQFDAYTDSSFPGIVDTMFEIENGEGQWEQLKQQVYIATYIIQSAASTLEDVGL